MGYYHWSLLLITAIITILLPAGTRVDAAGVAATTGDELRLYNTLFKNYKKHVRPRANAGQSVKVTIELELQHITKLDVVNQILSTVGFIATEWTDDFLVWNPAQFGGLEELIVPPSVVWVPDIAISNSASAIFDDAYVNHFRVHIYHTGKVVWTYGGNLETQCELDLTFYPLDKQKCNFTVKNWAYSNELVELHPRDLKIHMHEYQRSGMWEIERTTAVKDFYTVDVTGEDEKYPRIQFTLFLTRKFQYHFLNIFLPIFMLVILSLCMFWLPCDSGEKIGLGITIMLSYAVFLLVIQDTTPANSDFTPVITKFLMLVMSTSTISVVTTIIVLYMHHHHSDSYVPVPIRKFFFGPVARILCMRHVTMKYEAIAPTTADTTSIDKLGLVDLDENKADIPSPEVVTQDPAGGDPQLKLIAERIKILSDKVAAGDYEGNRLMEWRILAQLLDRFMFWIIVFVTLLGTPLILSIHDSSA